MSDPKRSKKPSVLPQLFRGSARYFIACILCGLALTLCELLLPQIIRVFVDSAIGSEAVSLPGFLSALLPGGAAWLAGHLALCPVLLAVIGLISALFRYFTNLFNAKAGETLVKTMRDRLYAHIHTLPWSWHMENPTGDIIQRCTSDVERVKTFFQEQFVAVFRISVLIVLSLICMAMTNLRLSLVAIVIFPIIVLYSVLFHNRIRERFTLCDEHEGVLSTIAQENLTGVRVVRAFGREAYERDRFEAQNKVYTDCWISLCRTLSNFWATGDLTSCVQVLLVVVLGSVLCVRGEMTVGEFISFAFYNSMLISPVRRLGRMISEMSKAGVSIDRVAEILNAEPERDAPGASEPPMDGDIAFENVTFRYGEGREVLKNLSFTIPAGSSFGILGGTGSGKSTLLLLLCRLYAPLAGRVTIGGEDIAAMRAAWLREHIGIVLQEPFLFSRTIGENIGLTGATAEDIRAAAVTACLDGDISRFPDGYDTPVGERGVTLSGGQKQRLAIARTLTKSAPILVFDDSLSAVDTETDENIRRALREKTAGTTSIIISHRITTLLDCDRVLVLDRGVLSQLGTPEELLSRPGIFRRIYDMQMSVGEEAEA